MADCSSRPPPAFERSASETLKLGPSSRPWISTRRGLPITCSRSASSTRPISVPRTPRRAVTDRLRQSESKRPADDDPLPELGVLSRGAGGDARLLRPVSQGRDDRAADDRDHPPDMRDSREHFQPILGQTNLLPTGIALSGLLGEDLARIRLAAGSGAPSARRPSHRPPPWSGPTAPSERPSPSVTRLPCSTRVRSSAEPPRRSDRLAASTNAPEDDTQGRQARAASSAGRMRPGRQSEQVDPSAARGDPPSTPDQNGRSSYQVTRPPPGQTHHRRRTDRSVPDRDAGPTRRWVRFST